MSTPSTVPDPSRAEQWAHSARGFSKWWDTIERRLQPVSDRLVELAGVEPGHRVLDLATGLGEPAVTAARRVGPTGHVLGVDYSGQMVAMARERAAGLGLWQIEFREGDAEALDLPEGAFDAILCRFGLMFLPNLDAALEGMRRLLAPGGCLAASVWGPPPSVPMISVAMAAATEVLGAPPSPPGGRGPFSLADIAALEQALVRAGFSPVWSEGLSVVSEFPSAESYAQYVRDTSFSLSKALGEQSPERREQVWQAVEESARKYAGADGVVRMPGEVVCVVGRAG